MSNQTRIRPDGKYRLKQILGDAKANPPIDPIIPVSKSTWYEKVQSGDIAKPEKWGRISIWTGQNLLDAMKNLAA